MWQDALVTYTYHKFKFFLKLFEMIFKDCICKSILIKRKHKPISVVLKLTPSDNNKINRIIFGISTYFFKVT